jgi:hypothetical protein
MDRANRQKRLRHCGATACEKRARKFFERRVHLCARRAICDWKKAMVRVEKTVP